MGCEQSNAVVCKNTCASNPCRAAGEEVLEVNLEEAFHRPSFKKWLAEQI